MSEVKVNTIKKYTGSSITIGESGDTITITSGANLSGSGSGLTTLNATQLTSGTLPDARFPATLPAVSGANLTGLQAALSFPTISSISPSTIENTATNVVITGTNFVSVPTVDAINSSTGAITPANTVTFTSATSITANFTLGTDGTYYIRVENNDGLAVRSTSALLTVSDAPVWSTAAGSLGTIAGGFSGTVATVTATGDTIAYSETTNVLTNASQANCSLNSSTGAITTSNFGGSATSATTYSFTLRATDAQGQTADRNFTLTSSYVIANSGRFD
jgi:hypothetical protein